MELERLAAEAQRAARESKGPLRDEMESRLKMVSEQLLKKQVRRVLVAPAL
jgi:hypothetical protein